MRWGVRKEKEKLSLYTNRLNDIDSKISDLQNRKSKIIRNRKIKSLQKKRESAQKNIDKYQGKLNKRQHKNEQYRDRLAKRYMNKSKLGKGRANEIGNDLKDLKKYGRNSEAWRKHVENELEYVDSISSGLNTYARLRTGTAFDKYVKDLRTEQKEWMDYSERWAKNSKKMLSTKVTAEMSYRDIRKSIRN